MTKYTLRISQKKIKEIVKKLERLSVHRLSFDEFRIYAMYRLVELIHSEGAIHYDELLYRFCEVGPGNRRFDPLAVEILLNSLSVQDYLKKSAKIECKDKWFLVKEAKGNTLNFRIKEKVLANIFESTKTDKLFKLLKDELGAVFQECEYEAISYFEDQDKIYIEFKLKSKEFDSQLLLRFYNTSVWVYPESWQIWDLFHKANLDNAIPVLIAPKIHGACFPLFKAIGMFARASYYLFIDKSLEEIKSAVLDQTENDFCQLSRISFGKIDNLPSKYRDERFAGAKHLLTEIIPNYHDSFMIKLNRAIGKINRLPEKFKNPSKFVIEPKERIQKIKELLGLKLGHLKSVGEMIKRNELIFLNITKS